MKTIFTLFASLLMSISVFAAARPNSILTITSADNAAIRVELDGKRYDANDNSIRIEGLEAGTHTIRVYKQRSTGVFSLGAKRFDLVYNTMINVKKRTNHFISINRNGRISMTENKIRVNNGRNDDRDGQWGDYDAHQGYISGMNAREFDLLLRSIDKEWLESNKLKSAIQVVRNNHISAAQVKELTLLFSFENNKLELAKQAYANTVDKRNYSLVFEVFSFSNSRIDLERYIRNYR